MTALPTPRDAGRDSGKRAQYLMLRFMRRPLFVLVAVYGASMIGWVIIPGPENHPEPLGFFHAFYFLTYTVTTTGFGEIPYAFSNAQRMWAIICLFAGVVAWLYAISAIIRLVQNPSFQRALEERRFSKSVARLQEPFVIVCGFGNRGSLLTRGLSDAGIAIVILDNDEDRINALYVRDYNVATPALVADARVPDRLIEAGLLAPNCLAVVALTSDEEVNAKIAIAARLLHPKIKVVTQLTEDIYEETLATLGGDLHIIDPFQTFGRYLAGTIHAPAIHMLYQWLVGSPGANLAMYADVPGGTWIVCGYGRMGRAVKEGLDSVGVNTVVIDPRMDEATAISDNFIVARINQRTLIDAGIGDAAGIVVCTRHDTENLGIALNARALNPHIFVLVRQNRHRNEILFSAAQADLIMQPNLVSARRILFLLIAPLLRVFFETMRDAPTNHRNSLLAETVRTLIATVGGDATPEIWTVEISPAASAAVIDGIQAGERPCLKDILRSAHDRSESLPVVALVIRSGGETVVMPNSDRQLACGDEILLCGRPFSRRLLDANLNNPYTLRYLLTGVDEPRSFALRWLTSRRAA